MALHAAPILKRLGILSHLERSMHVRCYGNQSIWGNSTIHETDFIFSPYSYGWHLDRFDFDFLLIQMAQATGVSLKQKTRITEITQNQN